MSNKQRPSNPGPTDLLQWHRCQFCGRLQSHPKFWAKVRKSPEPNGCWEWTGGKRRAGYGVISLIDEVDGKRVYTRYLAHRYSLELSLGHPLESGKNALHTCDNPSCVNPAHLYQGTAKDNIRDAITRGRWKPAPARRGKWNPHAKLTVDQVREIRALYAAGGITHRELGERYHVARTAIGAVISGRNWSVLDAPTASPTVGE